MSFYKIGYSGAATKKKKAGTKKKPKWDDTLHDLTAYKASDEEIMQRKAAHKSKNHMAYKLQQMRKGQKKENANAPLSQNQARQLAIMKEILYDQRQLKSVLDKTDNMMSVVKDLFGDDPKKYKGFPNITTAPNSSGDPGNRSNSLAGHVPEIYTRTEALSDSVMNPSALNDIPDSDSDDETGTNPQPIVYHPQMNLQRFQQFIANEEKNQTLSSIGGQAQLSHNEGGPIQSTQIQGMSGFETPPPSNDGRESIAIVRTPRSAINDTGKVKRTRNVTSNQSANTTQPSTMNLTDMRKVLENLQDEIAEFERQTGRRHPAEKQRSDTFSGYTVALVDAVSKLARYLRETDRRLQAEITVREQLTEEVHLMRNIIDALTSDVIVTQEEHGKVLNAFTTYKQKTDQELSIIKAALHGMGVQTSTRNFDERSSTITPPKHDNHSLEPPVNDDHFSALHQQSDTSNTASLISNVQGPALQSYSNTSTVATASLGYTGASQSLSNTSVRTVIPDHLQQTGAVLLSPPVRKTRVHDGQDHSDYSQHFHAKRQTSLVDLPSLANGNPSSDNSYSAHHTVATVNVPRPIPLSRPSFPQGGESSHLQHSSNVQAYDKLPAQVSVSVVRNPVLPAGIPKIPREDDMQSQIAELNKQHEEAQKRLQLLLIQQQQQKVLSQQDEHQQSRVYAQQSEEGVYPPSHISQSMLHQKKELMQQQQQIAQLLNRQSQSFANQNNHNNSPGEMSHNDVIQQQEFVMQQMQQQMRRIQQEQRILGFDVHRQTDTNINNDVTPPRDNNNQNGGPFSPAISPISQRSDYFMVTSEHQRPSKQTSRDIKISLPTAEFDLSLGETPSPLKI